jgi:hypothetical protein
LAPVRPCREISRWLVLLSVSAGIDETIETADLSAAIVARAILDVPLADGGVTPVVEAPMAGRIPLAFQSEFDLPPDLQQLCPDVPFY